MVEPFFGEEQVGSCSIYLRLGTDFRVLSPSPFYPEQLDSSQPPPLIKAIELGGPVRFEAQAGVLVTTLEYIAIPLGICGIVFLRNVWWSFFQMSPMVVDPGYRGTLALPILNVGGGSTDISSGARLAKLLLVKVSEPMEGSAYSDRAAFDNEASWKYEINRLRRRIAEQQDRLKTESTTPLPKLVREVLGADKESKGKALELLAESLFSAIRGLSVIKSNARLQAEELDLVVENNISDGFWRLVGSPIVVECKHWSGSVGAREISVLYDKMESISPDTKLGILIAPNGVSGPRDNNALLKIREKRQRGRYVVVLDRDDLLRIGQGDHASDVIETRFRQLMLI